MLLKGLLFLSGALICARLPALPGAAFAAGCSLVLSGIAYLSWRRLPLGGAAWLLGGFLWALLNAQWLLQRELSPAEEGKTLLAEGVIASLPEDRDRSIRFNFKVESLTRKGQAAASNPGLVRLSWYRQPPLVKPGERWRLKVRLKRPYGFRNPGGFDYEAWLFQNRIRATGYVAAGPGNAKLADAGSFDVNALRFALKNRLQAAAGEHDLAGFIPALTLGDRSGIEDAHWRTLTGTGTNHLIAISGLHIGLIAAFAYLFILKAWNFTLAPLTQAPGHRAAAAGALAAALFYALLAGFSLPTQRALVMLCAGLGMKLLGRAALSWDALGLALIAVLLFDPCAPLSVSFWLSFAAVAALFYGLGHRVDPPGRWRQWGRVQYVACLGLLPALAFHYQQIPLLSLPANLLAVPWVSFAALPLLLAGAGAAFIHEGAGGLLLRLGLWSLEALWRVLEGITAAPWHLLPVAQPPAPVLALAVVGTVVLLLPAGVTARWLGLFWLLPLFFPPSSGPAPGRVAATVLDVGQGLAVVLQTQRHSLLYDAGPAYGPGFNAGEAVVLPFLRKTGIQRIDVLVQSHGDNDHSGGLAGLIGDIPIARVLTSAPEAIPALDSLAGRASRGAFFPRRAQACQNGQSWDWDGARFEMLHPAPDSPLGGNDRSCVLKITAGATSLLLTGDIEANAERRLVERHGAGLQSAAVVAPHHGSKTSSTPAFVRAVAPELTVFPVGYRNRFNLPNQAIIDRYREQGAKLLTTARSGAIQLKIGGAEIDIAEYRKQRRRFWHVGE